MTWTYKSWLLSVGRSGNNTFRHKDNLFFKDNSLIDFFSYYFLIQSADSRAFQAQTHIIPRKCQKNNKIPPLERRHLR
jgi:hypothetical protein